MNGSSLHFLKTKYGKQKLHYHLNIFQERRLDPLILKNQCLTSILHLFSIEIVFEPCLTHIINQTTLNLDIGIQYGVVEIIDYSFFTTEPIFFGFWKSKCLIITYFSRCSITHLSMYTYTVQKGSPIDIKYFNMPSHTKITMGFELPYKLLFFLRIR
jgi:hypothetical protein